MKFAIVSALFLFLSFQAKAVDPIRIEFGNNYDGYSNEELKRRVWQLERAVSQLQDQVFQLAMSKGPSKQDANWTCQIQSFGKVYVATRASRASALAQVLKKCGDASDAVHCSESAVKCDNE